MDERAPAPRDYAQTYALSFPGAYPEHPWGETVIKVNQKVFLFVNGAIAPEDGVSLSVKLPHTGADLLEMPFAEPMGYGMGKHGWVTLRLLRDDHIPLELLQNWVEESYRAVAPKGRVAELDALPSARAQRPIDHPGAAGEESR